MVVAILIIPFIFFGIVFIWKFWWTVGWDIFILLIVIFWQFILYVFIATWMNLLYSPIEWSITKIIGNITILHEKIEENITSIQVIDEILDKLEDIARLYTDLSWISKWRWYLDDNDIIELRKLTKESLQWLIPVLTDLRSDLQIRLREQQQSLEKAKSEVEQTIKWSTELEQVSELQQARLDRQIAQFEELQRVLVKG